MTTEEGRGGLRHQVTPTGTCVEGELEEILRALRVTERRLRERLEEAERSSRASRIEPTLTG